jgi:Regulator of ribonuclease activity B
MSELEEHLARDEALWRAWCEEGVTEHTPLAVDFGFYATKREAAEALAGALREAGFQDVKVRVTRTLWVFKGWSVSTVEQGTWSLARLQDRTRVFCELAEAHRCRLEGCGAMMPGERGAEPGAPPNGGPAEPSGSPGASSRPPSVS